MIPVVLGVIISSTRSGSKLCVIRIDIAKNRGDLLPLQAVGRGDESERRNDHLPFQIQGPDSNLQRHSPVAHGDAVPDPEKVRQLFFELLDKRPVIAQPPFQASPTRSRNRSWLPIFGRPTWRGSGKHGLPPSRAKLLDELVCIISRYPFALF